MTVRGLNGHPLDVSAGRPRNPEVEDLGLATVGDEHVGRLEIAVDDATVVRVLHGVGQLDDQADAWHARTRLAKRRDGHHRAHAGRRCGAYGPGRRAPGRGCA